MTEDSKTFPLAPGTRIAIISGSFRSGYSYQENIWAERLAARQCAVRVFCAESGHTGENNAQGFSVQSIPVRGLSERNLCYEQVVGVQVTTFDPELILWFGAPQIFGRSLLSMQDIAPLIIFMGQNRRMQAFDWTAPGLTLFARAKAVAYRLVRGPTIVDACRRADLIVANTEETPEILKLYLGDTDSAAMDKMLCFPLGYDPDTFAYKADRRAQARTEMGLSEDVVLAVISSRFAPEKEDAINHLLEGAIGALGGAPQLQLAVVGLGSDQLSHALRTRCDAHPMGERIHLFPFADRERLSDHFHAADIALFAQPSISCQEALGTGAYGIFADDGTMDWLLPTHEVGALYETGNADALLQAIHTAVSVLSNTSMDRTDRAGASGWLNYDQIIAQVLGALPHR